MTLLGEAVAQLTALERGIARAEARERILAARGWSDDFLGQALHEQYEPRTDALGVGSYVALVNNAHGGVVRLYAGAAVAAYGRLMLGEQSDLYDTLDPDEGFRIIARWKLSHTTNVLGDMFVNAPAWNHIHVVADTAHGPNWYIRNDNNIGVDNWEDSGVAIDTDWHVHELAATSGRAEHLLDGALINVSTTKIPTVPMTPDMRCLARAAAARYVDLDWWTVRPQNL